MQSLKPAYTQESGGTQPGKVDPSHPAFHWTGGDKNMANTSERHGPGALATHFRIKEFNPGEPSIAKPDDEVYTRFPLPKRTHERSENLNGPATVYNIAEHPGFKPQNQGDKKREPYQPYKEKYRIGNVVIIYGHRTKKEEAKSPYSTERNPQQPEAKNDYKADFPPANDNKKAMSLYERANDFIAKTYDGVSRAISYLTRMGYDKKPTQGAKTLYFRQGNEDYFDGVRNIAGSAAYGMPVEQGNNVVSIVPLLEEQKRKEKELEMIVSPSTPANDNSLEQKLAA